MKKLYAFLMGAYELRLTCTSNFEDENGDDPHGHQCAYEWGREWAHRLTFRHFEP